MAFNPEKLTVKAGQALRHAQELAEENSHRILRPLHILKALLDEDQGIMKPLLQRVGVNVGQLASMVDSEIDRLPQSTGSDEPVSAGPEAVKVLNAADKQARDMGDEYTSTEHLLLALTQVEDQAKRMLALNAVNEADILEGLKEVRGGQSVTDQNPEEKYQALEKYGVDLVQSARDGKI
ncbi:MAG TPA: ATP-dependent chaperone ClpB, partial [Planctomycetes bacterium]|nr:ATP-dependent chaperone ClpB [Planctomycetota bacterium]